MRNTFLGLMAVLLALGAGLPAAAQAPTRLYLTSTGGLYNYWTTDPSDPELNSATAHFHCGPGVPSPRGCTPSFAPAAVLDTPVTWSAQAPVRFHLEMAVDTAAEYTVHAAFLDVFTFSTSAAAEEVAPGVWEGTITEGGRWDSGRGNRLYIFLRSAESRVPMDVDLQLAGRSWFELPTHVPGRGVPELLRQSPDAAQPAAYATPARTFWFNDGQYDVHTFAGDLSATKTFDVPIPRQAETVYAWVEAYDAPFVHHVVRDREADTRRLTDTPILTLTRNGATVAEGNNQRNQRGRGSNALATTRVAPGTVSLDVSSMATQPPPDQPYKAYVLVVYGERTLQRMHWRYEPAIAEPFIPARAVAGTCINPTEPVPTTAAVTTFLVDIGWDTVGMPTARYTIGHAFPNGSAFNCGEGGVDDTVRFTVPGARVWHFSATPTRDTAFVGYRDTVFEMDVRYSYTPVP